jgi:hypothetical protein
MFISIFASTIPLWFFVCYLVVSFSASLFYSLKAYDIFTDVKDIKDLKWTQKLHQFWFNFLGSSVGWATAFFLVVKIFFITNPLFLWTDIILGIIAFIGITGHLPRSIVGIVVSLGDLVSKIIK